MALGLEVMARASFCSKLGGCYACSLGGSGEEFAGSRTAGVQPRLTGTQIRVVNLKYTQHTP